MTTIEAEPIALTPQEQGVFHEFFKKAELPVWFTNSTASQRKTLYDGLIASFASRDEARVVLHKLQSPNPFASMRLAEALSAKLEQPVEITGAVFQHVRSVSSLLGLRRKLVLPLARDLLQAACENFTAGETSADNFHPDSLIYLPPRFTGQGNRILPLKPHEFASLCRDLDLGKQYQQHLEQVLEKDLNAQQVCVTHSRRSIEVDLCVARMKNHITQDTYERFHEALKNSPANGFSQDVFSLHSLKLLDCTLYGVLVLQLKTDDNRCVLYLPGDPDQPLEVFTSLQRLEVRLSARIRHQKFRDFFSRYVALGEQVEFQRQLKTRLLEPSGGSPLPKQLIYLPLTVLDIEGDGLTWLFLHRLALVKKTARLLVVPTGDEDEKERLARLETYKTVGIDLALFAASFLPGIGEILMAVTAFQLLKGVYLGIESWTRGDQEQAAEYFFDTTENLILAAVLAAGQHGVTSAYRAVKNTRLIAELRQIKLSDGLTRLWKPDLTPYRQNLSLPDWIELDERGLRWYADQAYLRMGPYLYAVRPQVETELWEIQPPAFAPDAYMPVLETNDLGAWRHDSELPQQWERLTLLRRLGYGETMIDDASALQAMNASAVHENALRQAILDRCRPPGALIDTVQRFSADRSVSQFIEQLRAQNTAVHADYELQLYLLTTLHRWPAHTAVSIVDFTGQSLKSFSATGPVNRFIKISREALGQGRIYTEVLDALNQWERANLLSTVSGIEVQEEALREVVLEQAVSNNVDLFERLYQRTSPVLSEASSLLVDKHPGLPASIAGELVWFADTHEVLELEAGSVPLLLAEEARRYLQVIRENRAFEGLYLNAAGATDTHRIVLDALEHLPGWKQGIHIQILDGTLTADVVAALGSAQSEEHLQILAQRAGYQVLNKQFEQIAQIQGRTREHFFQVLWQGLSQDRRSALGAGAVDGASILRQKITAMAIQRREFAHLTLSNYPVRVGYTSPMRLADRVQSLPLTRAPASSVPSGNSVILRQRAQELYPSHTLEQISNLLRSLGAEEALILARLEQLRLDFSGLRDTLQRWVIRNTWHQSGDGPRVKVRKLAKFRVAMQIIRTWRRETPRTKNAEGSLYELSLPPLLIGELPLLVGDFSHVGALIMPRNGLGSSVSRFLSAFTNLRVLSLAGNELERVPVAISQMPQLETLELNENRIHLTAESAALLTSIGSLKRLELGSNPELGRSLDVSRLPLLEHLGLRNTGIRDWPTGTNALLGLRTLDLRDNRIEHIPQGVLVSSDLLNYGTDIRGNPLSADSITRLSAYQHLNDISLGLISAGPTDVVARVLVDISMSSVWLNGVSEELALSRRNVWRSMFLQADSRQFFALLIRMRYSVDYRLAYSPLREKVWGVIESAAEDAVLRRSLFRMAEADTRSIDDCSLLFSDLVVRVLCHRASTVTRFGEGRLELQFVRLLRSLFRLHEVEKQAHKHIIALQQTEVVTAEQAIQIGFLFRMRLAQQLDLLNQPTVVNERLDVEVSADTLDQVYRQVLRQEQGQGLVNWFKVQPFWMEYLTRAYTALFEEVDIRSRLALLELDGLTELSRAQLSARMAAIVENTGNARRALLTRLTQDALQRYSMEPSLVDVPVFAVSD